MLHSFEVNFQIVSPSLGPCGQLGWQAFIVDEGEPEDVLGVVVVKHFKVELATGQGEAVCGVVPIAPEEEFGVFVDEEVGVYMLADLERQDQEGGRGIHTNELARNINNRSMMGIKRMVVS